MNKVTTAALAGLVAVTATANASMSRWNGFGAANAYIADVQDIWSLPGVVASHKNTSYFEFGTAAAPNVSGGVSNNPAGTWGGVHSALGPGVLGIWVGRGQNANVAAAYAANTTNFFTTGNFAPGTFTNLGLTAPGGANAAAMNSAVGTTGRVDILYGFAISDTVELGVLLSRANRNAKQENVGNVSGSVDSVDAGALGLGLGAELKELAIFKLLEIGLTFDSDSILASTKTTAGEDKLEFSASNIGLRVGGDIDGGEGKFGRAELGYSTSGSNSKNGVTSATVATGDKEFKYNAMGWNLGYAMGKSGDKGMGLMGLMLMGTGSSMESDGPNTKSDAGSLALQLTSAGEAKVKEWLTARAGIAANLYQSSSATGAGAVNPTKTSTSNNGATTISTGLSATFGDVVIDGVLNQDVLYTGTFLISGVAESLFGQVSATWGW
jgi:hypothetical protein